MKRPLTYVAIVFVVVLLVIQIGSVSIIRQTPIEKLPDGQINMLGYRQNDTIVVCGTVRDYSYENQYGKTVTELVLKEIQILPRDEDKSKTNNLKAFLKDSDMESIFQTISKKGQSIIVYLDESDSPIMGSRVIVCGELDFWKKATNPGEFDAEKFYINRGILFAVKDAHIIKASIYGNKLLQGLKEFRLKQETYLERYLPDGNAAIMKAMLFGNKKEMDEETKELYQKNGIAHILAISGLHISLLGMSIYRVLQRFPFPRWIILMSSGSFLVLYCFMVGFSASAFRALVMFSFFLVGKLVKRSYDMITAMACSAVIWLIIHPEYMFDCGFQLSYGAIIGIGILMPVLKEITDTIKWKWLRKGIGIFIPSLAVNLITAPILIFHYYELSFFSIALNLIVLPLMAPLLLSGICMLAMANLVGSVSNFPITICAVPVNLILWIYEMGCHLLEMLPIGRKNISPLSVGEMILYYSIIFVMTVLVKKKSHIYQLGFPIACILILVIPPRPVLAVWALDVGQGDCNVIFTEEGNCFIIDCGSTSKYNVGKKILIPFLKYHGTGSVDGVIISHPDTDHMNGILELIELGKEENIEVKGIFIYEKGLVNEPKSWEELMELANGKKIPVYGIGQGDILQNGTFRIECLYPLEEQDDLTGNASSLVMSMENGNFKGLFTGDMEAEGERILLNEYAEQLTGQMNYNFLKVGHHGSSTSTSSEFLQWAAPEYAIISCGKNNIYGHPHIEVIERLKACGSKIVSTSESGAFNIKSLH